MKSFIPMIAALAALAALAVGGCGGSSDSSSGSTEASGGATTASAAVGKVKPRVEVPEGAPPKHLVVKDLVEGHGKAVESGDELTIEYIGVLYDGRKFTDSWERAKPFKFQLGSHYSFADPSWEKGLQGMRLDGRRELIVPPIARGASPETPADETIVYVIDLVAVD